MSFAYRPDIDGLRALAVSAVIAYHFGIGEVSGGFLGVDVFFVISGYLISSIILREMQQGVFSFKQFYLRRVRRIFPALFSMMLVTWPLAYRWLLPEQFEEFSNSLIYVSLFVSNLFFAGKTGYFDTAIETKPLIHTWSLAVEEQYYLLFPVVLLLLARRSQSVLVYLSLIAIVFSFGLAVWQPLGKTFAFFSVLTRIWEFFFGFLASLIVLRGKSTQSVWLAYVGLMLIVLAFVLADESFIHPGWITLAPVVGCWLLIINPAVGSLVYRLLCCKPVRLIGLMSYSLYLWHQPLLVFYRYQQTGDTPYWHLLLLLTVLLFIAWLSWRYIESPFRDRRRVSDGHLTRLAIAISLAVLGVGYSGQAADGFPNRFDMPEKLRGQFEQKKSAQNCQPIAGSEFKLCSLGASPEQAKATMAVFGDSHALALIPVFEQLGKQNQIQFIHIAESACPPLQGVYVRNAHTGTDFCRRLAEKQWETLKQYPKIKQVIWAAKWASYTDGNYQGGQLNWLGTTAKVESDVNTTRQIFSDALRQTAERYQTEGLNLAVVVQVPQQLLDVKQVYYRVFDQLADPQVQSDRLRRYAVPKVRHEQLQAYNRSVLNQLAAAGLLQVINLDSQFCDDEVCRLGDLNQTWYRDADHLSVVGALGLAEQLTHSIDSFSNTSLNRETAINGH
jgi:peptidoglycan/LPS O-acetylase OafA/YrhL